MSDNHIYAALNSRTIYTTIVDINEMISCAQTNQQYRNKNGIPTIFQPTNSIIKVDFIVEEYTLKFVMESVNFEPQLT